MEELLEKMFFKQSTPRQYNENHQVSQIAPIQIDLQPTMTKLWPWATNRCWHHNKIGLQTIEQNIILTLSQSPASKNVRMELQEYALFDATTNND
jgi:hypothetical protein